MQLINTLKQKMMGMACQGFALLKSTIKKINLPKILTWSLSHKKHIAVAIALIYGTNYAINYFFPKSKSAVPTQLVTTAVVQKSSIPIIIEATGNIVAANIVDIRPQT
ncbi:MAG: hypothetical protein EBW87_05520, partial [Burkholderiaceae bacterium]|nr:hypothetical protein [Burkholderiaceae bacterium]